MRDSCVFAGGSCVGTQSRARNALPSVGIAVCIWTGRSKQPMAWARRQQRVEPRKPFVVQ